jgi:hypothetical protein
MDRRPWRRPGRVLFPWVLASLLRRILEGFYNGTSNS